MHLVIHGPQIAWKTESYKGVLYVLVSGLILFLAIRERDSKHRAELARNEAMLRGLRRSGLLGIYTWSAQGQITDANSTFLDSIGYTHAELLSGKLNQEGLTPPEYREADQIAAAQMLKTGHSTLYEKEIIRKDGSRLPVLIGQARIERSPDWGIGYALDLSETKANEAKNALLQRQLLQSERLNALGLLAGGIAHDFNNILNIIIGHATLVESRLSSDPEKSSLRENAAQILNAADKGRSLSRKLLVFGRRDVSNPERLKLNELISEWHGMLNQVLDKRFTLVLNLAVDAGSIQADRSEIEQVILNLVLNARDAMPNGGEIEIETSRSVLPDDTHPRLSGEYVVVRIRDTGVGMDEALASKIFEPFFTTKKDKSGTGLGLAMVYGIVQRFRGHIEVDSKLGHGSVFTIYFPRVYAPSSSDIGPELNCRGLTHEWSRS